MSTDTLTLALWALHTGHEVASADEWLQLVADRLEAARAAGADALMLPEYCCEHWLWWAPDDLAATDQPAWFADQANDMLAALQTLARESGLILIAGTFAVRDPDSGKLLNRCHVLFPDGHIQHQDKLCLTPREQDEDGWYLNTGNALTLFEINGFKTAITICLDVELPALAAALAAHKPDLLLVPSMTKMVSGYSRVFGCAKARAIELQCAVAVTGVIGSWFDREPNTGAAAVYLPCEQVFGYDGIHAALEPTDTTTGPGPLLIARDIPLAAIRQHRNTAEVWPGDWSAEHVSIAEA